MIPINSFGGYFGHFMLGILFNLDDAKNKKILANASAEVGDRKSKSNLVIEFEHKSRYQYLLQRGRGKKV